MSRFGDWFKQCHQILSFSLPLSLFPPPPAHPQTPPWLIDFAFLCWFHSRVIFPHMLQNWPLAPLNLVSLNYPRLLVLAGKESETENTSVTGSNKSAWWMLIDPAYVTWPSSDQSPWSLYSDLTESTWNRLLVRKGICFHRKEEGKRLTLSLSESIEMREEAHANTHTWTHTFKQSFHPQIAHLEYMLWLQDLLRLKMIESFLQSCSPAPIPHEDGTNCGHSASPWLNPFIVCIWTPCPPKAPCAPWRKH